MQQPIAVPPSVATTTQPTPQQMIDALHTAFGEHRARAVHAKGVMARGEFTPSRDARAITDAAPFRGSSARPVVVRFSDFTGIPDIPDTSGSANPRGFAIKIVLPRGQSMDVVAHSFNGFPTATSEEFRELLVAIGTSGASAAKPTPLDRFLASHPVAKTFLTTQKPAPASYTTLSYFGVNAFRFTSTRGGQVHVRYRFVPVGGEAFVPEQELSAMSGDYLVRELPVRLARGPMTFEWYAQVAGPGDILENPSVAWPDNRRLVHLGTIRVTGIVADPVATDRETTFSPTNVPNGIVPADPMLIVRRGAYPISAQHRQ